jgi:hypothetical protein
MQQTDACLPETHTQFFSRLPFGSPTDSGKKEQKKKNKIKQKDDDDRMWSFF